VKFWLHIWLYNIKFKWNLNKNSYFPQFCVTLKAVNRGLMCAFLQLWSFEKLNFKVQTSFSLFSLKILFPSPFTHFLLPSSSYPWPPMVVSLFLTRIILEVTSPITFHPSLFYYHWSSRSKELNWWRRSKAYSMANNAWCSSM